MSMQPEWSTTGRLDRVGASADSSALIRFMNAVYAWMCVGLATTALVGWYVASQPELMRSMFTSGVFWVLVIAQFALVWVISAATQKVNAAVATGLFLLYSALNGVLLSSIFIVYTKASITGAFIATAGTFGAMSVYGMVTKRDLTNLGGFLMMALFGLIIASIVNIFFASSGLYWLITYAGIFIFVGLTAYDTQKLKQMAYQLEGNPALAARMSIVGSLVLYLDFINLFLFILRLMGERRR